MQKLGQLETSNKAKNKTKQNRKRQRIIKDSLVYEAFVDAESQGKIYYTQFYFAL